MPRRPPASCSADRARVLALPFEWNGWTRRRPAGSRATWCWGPTAGTCPRAWWRAGADAVEACRIASGVPAMGTELTGKTIAAEAGLVERDCQLHEGVLHRPGAGRPHRRPRLERARARWSGWFARGFRERAVASGDDPAHGRAPAGDARGGGQGRRHGHLGGVEQRARRGGSARATCTAASRRPGRCGCARGRHRRLVPRRVSPPCRWSTPPRPAEGGHRVATRIGEPGGALRCCWRSGIAYALVAAATTPFTWRRT